MNKVILGGYLSFPPTTKTMVSKKMLSNVISVKSFKGKDGKYTYQNISIRAWDKVAEYLEKYACKGCKLLVTGSIQVDKYAGEDGETKVSTYVLVTEINELQRPVKTEPEPEPEERIDIGDPFGF